MMLLHFTLTLSMCHFQSPISGLHQMQLEMIVAVALLVLALLVGALLACRCRCCCRRCRYPSVRYSQPICTHSLPPRPRAQRAPRSFPSSSTPHPSAIRHTTRLSEAVRAGGKSDPSTPATPRRTTHRRHPQKPPWPQSHSSSDDDDCSDSVHAPPSPQISERANAWVCIHDSFCCSGCSGCFFCSCCSATNACCVNDDDDDSRTMMAYCWFMLFLTT